MNEGDGVTLKFPIKLYLQGQMEQKKREKQEEIDSHILLMPVLAHSPLSNYVLFNFFESVSSYVKWGHYKIFYPAGFHRDHGNIFKGMSTISM